MKIKNYLINFWNWLISIFKKKNKALDAKVPYAKRIIKPGQICWECDLTTGNIDKAEIVAMPFVDKKGRERRKLEVIMKKGCIYEIAINGENAVRKFEARILAAAKVK